MARASGIRLRRAASLTSLAAIGVYAAPAAACICPPIGRVFGIATALADRHAIALTFDDGPHPQGTPAVLSQLARYNVSATFFLSGAQVARYPEVAQEIHAAGHEIALHGYTHRLQLVCGPAVTIDEIVRSRDEVARATGVVAERYRPPYGVANGAAILAARTLRLQVVVWSRWGRDWKRDATPLTITTHATRCLRGGEIVLLHDADHYATHNSWRATADSVGRIIETAWELGLAVRSIREVGAR